MINVEQVKRDVVNYGTLKVYTTFLTISEDEVDPELFNASQLKEIFNSRFDTVKVNIDFVEMQEGKLVSVAKELLVFKLSKCSDNEISYMSNVDDEGKLSSLVLTKSGDEVSLDVVEYSIGGDSPVPENVAKVYAASHDAVELSAEEIIEVVNGGYQLVKLAGDENTYGYVLEGYAGQTGHYFLDILIDEGTGLKKHSYHVENTSVTHTASAIGGGTKLYKHVIEDTNNARLTIISTSNTELTDSNILTKFNSGEFVSNSCLLEVFAGSWGTFDSAIICKSIVDGSMKFGYRGVGTLSSFTAFTIASDVVTEL